MSPRHLRTFFLLHVSICISEFQRECQKHWYDQDSFVCTCDSSYCDTVEPETLTPGWYNVYESSRDSLRFRKSTGPQEESGREQCLRLTVSTDKKYQSLLGFGGALTDSAAYHIAHFPDPDAVLRNYFSTDGIEYSFLRLPIAGCDFSLKPYSYDDEAEDTNLTHFRLADEDLEWKLPVLNRIKSMSSRKIKIIASPWSAPSWMKTNGKFNGWGRLKTKYLSSWAEYFVRFLQAYEREGHPVWGITVQNEPTSGFLPGYPFNCMGWTPFGERKFIRDHLGPALKSSGYGGVQLFIMDDNRISLPWWPYLILIDKEAAQYVSGIAVHWYLDWLVPAFVLTWTSWLLPDYPLLATESCHVRHHNVLLGSWSRAEDYARSIIEDLLHGVTGWIDWNLVLDEQGGPNWASNFVDASIIVNASRGEFYKQPMFYVLGHFSKFFPEGSQRVGLETEGVLWGTAFSRKDGVTGLVVLNSDDDDIPLCIEHKETGHFVNRNLTSRSISTFLWK